MGARYLVRLDDACPGMASEKWNRIEANLDRFAVSPIVAVIPDNRDPTLLGASTYTAFWNRIRTWQDRGWAIAMHGLHHSLETEGISLVPFGRKSEFVGLSLLDQKAKIRKGYEILLDHGIRPRIWVAPNHSFDENTLEAIKEMTDISMISDGLALKPFRSRGFLWIPQQLWSPRTMGFGVWTICLHPSRMAEMGLVRFERFLEQHQREFVAVEGIGTAKSDRSLLDRLFAAAFTVLYRIKTRKRGTGGNS